MEPFLKLLQGAIYEIANSYYTEEDKEALFDALCKLEYEAISYYYKSWLSFLPWGIKLKHNIYRREELLFSGLRIQTIKVPLREYRAMQYVLSASKKSLDSHRKEESIDKCVATYFSQ